MGKRLTQCQFIEKLNKKFPGEELELMDDYKNKRTKVMIKHGKCGRIIDTRTAGDWLYTAITACPLCYDPRSKPLEDFLKDVGKYSDNTIRYLDGYEHESKSNIRFQCLNCNKVFRKSKYNVYRNIKRNGSICPYCSKLRKLTTEEFNNKLLLATNNNYSICNNYINNRTKINVVHSKCGKITKEVTPERALKGLSCNHCYPKSASYKERFIIKLLRDYNVDYEKEKTFKDLKSKSGYPLRFDFCITGKNGIVLIEYDGEHHIKGEGYLSNNTIKNDKIKNEYCEVNNITLYRIKDCSDEDLEDKIKDILYKEPIVNLK